jgi:hypothetical protein
MANEQSNGIQLPHGKQENPAKRIASNLQTKLEQPSIDSIDQNDIKVIASRELDNIIFSTNCVV